MLIDGAVPTSSSGVRVSQCSKLLNKHLELFLLGLDGIKTVVLITVLLIVNDKWKSCFSSSDNSQEICHEEAMFGLTDCVIRFSGCEYDTGTSGSSSCPCTFGGYVQSYDTSTSCVISASNTCVCQTWLRTTLVTMLLGFVQFMINFVSYFKYNDRCPQTTLIRKMYTDHRCHLQCSSNPSLCVPIACLSATCKVTKIVMAWVQFLYSIESHVDCHGGPSMALLQIYALSYAVFISFGEAYQANFVLALSEPSLASSFHFLVRMDIWFYYCATLIIQTILFVWSVITLRLFRHRSSFAEPLAWSDSGGCSATSY